MAQQQDQVEEVWGLIEAIKIAMVVTHDGRGHELRARPMAAHSDPLQNVVYFLTDVGSAKVAEIVDNDDVCLAFADPKGRDYLSITGHASLSNDRTLIRRLWSDEEQAFWRDENDPSLRLLRVDVLEAEYWRGPAAVTGYVKTLLAHLANRRPALRDNEKVRLSAPLGSLPRSPGLVRR